MICSRVKIYGGLIRRVLVCSLVSTFFFSSEINEKHFLGFVRALTVSVDKTNPAYVAWEDVNSEIVAVDKVLQVTNYQQLSLNKFNFPAEDVSKYNFVGLKVAKHSQIVKIVSDIEPPSFPDVEIYREDGSLKTIEERKVAIANYYSQKKFASHVPSVGEKAKELVETEIRKASSIDKGTLVTHSGSLVLISTSKTKKESTATEKKSKIQKNKINSKSSYSLKKSRTHKFSGELLITGGVAYTGVNDRLDIFQVNAGTVVAVGEVNIHEGKYYLETSNFSGAIIAELRSKSGVLMGAGEVSLYNLPSFMQESVEEKRLNLVVKPVNDEIKVSVVSAESNRKTRINNARVFLSNLDRELISSEDGLYKDPYVSTKSNYVVGAYAEGYWAGLTIGNGSEENEVKLFSVETVKALINLTVDPYYIEESNENGVVWGEVFVDGMPVDGAIVEIAGDTENRPIYFNSFIPDKNKNETGANGQFVIVNATSGLKVLRVKWQGEYYPAELVVVQKRHVSSVRINISKPKVIEIQSYDVTSGLGLPVDVYQLGSDSVINSDQNGFLTSEVPYGHGLVMYEGTSGELYQPFRFLLDRKAHYFELKQFKFKKLNSIFQSKKINIDADKGIVIGFIDTDDFVITSGSEIKKGQNVIYFDEFGNLVSDGKRGGGFIMYNVPAGMNSVGILNKSSSTLINRIYISDPEVTFILQAE